jgi:hypothetical protein
MTADVTTWLDRLDAVHGRIIRDDRAAEWLRLTQEHDALPWLIAALRAVFAKCDDMEAEAPVGRFFADEFRRVIADAVTPAVEGVDQ